MDLIAKLLNNEATTWSGGAAAARQAADQGDRYHELPEQVIHGDAPTRPVWPWIAGAAVVAGVAILAKGRGKL